jgi:hypothetical protein
MSKTLPHQYDIVIGDWSGDGHGQCDHFTFDCSHPEKEIHAAYRKAVEKCGIGLHEPGKDDKFKQVLGDYEDCYILADDYAKLVELGVGLPDHYDYVERYGEAGTKYGFHPKGVAALFLEMVRTQLEGFGYEFVERPVINGFWKDGFNHSFGYGAYRG